MKPAAGLEACLTAMKSSTWKPKACFQSTQTHKAVGRLTVIQPHANINRRKEAFCYGMKT